jgi:hypothetical protein
MRDRCNNPRRKSWAGYGGRGIKVCEEWDDYGVFRDWALANGWNRSLQIDRIDNDGPYSPENCRIVDARTNLRNTRRARMLTIFGETKCMADWADDERCSISYQALESRLRSGWSVEDALTQPPRTRLRSLGGMGAKGGE